MFYKKKLVKKTEAKNENAPSEMSNTFTVLRKMHCVQSSSFIDKAHKGRINSKGNFKMDIRPHL